MGKHIKDEDFVNMKFGRLTPVRRVANRGKSTFWLFRCDCGNEKEICKGSVVNGHTMSCGCIRRENKCKHSITHGMSKSSEFSSWRSMKKRVLNPKHEAFERYKHLHICDRWLNSFQNFYDDMGPKPCDSYHIDRIDNDQGYYPDNCRWVPIKINMRNKKNSKVWHIRGRVFGSTTEAAKALNMSRSGIFDACNGKKRKDGSFTPPQKDCYSELKYPKKEIM